LVDLLDPGRHQRHPPAGEHLRESWLSSDQVVTDLDDKHYRISATVVETAMLEWWLRGFGNAVSQIEKKKIGDER